MKHRKLKEGSQHEVTLSSSRFTKNFTSLMIKVLSFGLGGLLFYILFENEGIRYERGWILAV